MSTFKKTKVVMLPTNEKANLLLTGRNDLYYSSKLSDFSLKEYIDRFQHLYFLSNEEIKDGEYGFCMNLFNKGNQPYQIIFKMDSEQRQAMIELGGQKNANVFKIIATTQILRNSPILTDLTGRWFLPQPSQSFIEKFVEEYNKGNQITEVLVEYEEGKYNLDELRERHLKGLPHSYDYCNLKINPKDNTITIRKAKDSWSREEVIELLHRRMEYTFGGDYDKSTTDKWIEENL